MFDQPRYVLNFLSSRGPVTSRRRGLWRVAAAAAVLAVPVLGAGAAEPAASGSLLGSDSPYIVTATSVPLVSVALSAVETVGGAVIEQLGVANSVLADLNPLEVTALGLFPGISVVPDVDVSLEGTAGTASSDPADVFAQQTGATQLWAAGDTGQGVNVAVLDTGIDPLADFSGRLVAGVDLSGGNDPFEDGYGHGTFVAGLIAGDGASSSGQYTGEAPGAGLVSVKVAGASGETDLATVIAGVGWTVANRVTDHIGVLNMSLGYLPIISTTLDPLDVAVQAAWDSGIVVVASAGNGGPYNGTILSPGDDPMIITAGALDDGGQTSPSDDTMAPFSSAGPTSPDGWFKPDLVASGTSVVSLAAPGSTIYKDHPSARVGTANFVGSGTSFSAAITSGAAALILQEYPGITPDQVKARLLASTLPGPVGNPFVDGHGDLDVYAALHDGPAGSVNLLQNAPRTSVSLGRTVSLETTWSSSSWNPANWSADGWDSEAWNGQAWNADGWDGEAWNGTTWNGTAWDSEAWNSEAWNGATWDSEAWNSEAWNSEAWNSEAWNSEAWNSDSWG